MYHADLQITVALSSKIHNVFIPSQVMAIMFKVRDLAVTSPATVSHCGMVYLGPSILGLSPFVHCWLHWLSDAISLTKMNCTLSSTSSLRYMFMKQEHHCGVLWSRILTESRKNGLRCSHSLSKAKLRLRKTWSRSLRKSVSSALHGSKGMCTSALHG